MTDVATEPYYLQRINMMDNFTQIGSFEIAIDNNNDLRGAVYAATKNSDDNAEVIAYKKFCEEYSYVVLEINNSEVKLDSPFVVRIALRLAISPTNIYADNITMERDLYEAYEVQAPERVKAQRKMIVSLHKYTDDIWKHTGLFTETEELSLASFKMNLVANKKLGSAITSALSLVRCRVPHLHSINMEELTLSQHTSWRYDLQEEVMNQFAHLCALLWRVNNVRDHKQYLQAFWLKDYKAAVEGSISFFKRVHYVNGKWIRTKRTFDWT